MACLEWSRVAKTILAGAIIAAFFATGQTPIQYGNTVTGAIECGAENTFTILASHGDKLVAHVTETSDAGGVCYGIAACAFDQCVEIRDESNQLLGMACSLPDSNACSHRARTQLGPLTIPYDGRYSIKVRDANNFGRGGYTLSVQRVDSPARADVLIPGEPRLVPVQLQGEFRTFTVDGVEGTLLAFESTVETGGIVPRLALYGPDGDLAALPEGGRIQHTVTQSGKHTLLAFSALDELGTYRIRVTYGSTRQVLSQIADGGGWSTTLTLVNQGNEPAPFSLRFWTGAGLSWAPTFDGKTEDTIPAGGSRTIGTLNRGSTTSQGWGELITAKQVGIAGTFQSGSGHQAVVPGGAPVRRFLLPFDNTQSNVTSVALANTNDSRPVVISVVFRDESGKTLSSGTLPLPARGHSAFALPVEFPAIQNRRGVAEFSVDVPEITGLGLLFSASGAFTSIPIQPVSP